MSISAFLSKVDRWEAEERSWQEHHWPCQCALCDTAICPRQTQHKHHLAGSQIALWLSWTANFMVIVPTSLVHNLVTYPRGGALRHQNTLRKTHKTHKSKKRWKCPTHSQTSEQGYATSTPPRVQGQLVTYNLWLSPTDVDGEQHIKTCKNTLHASKSRDTCNSALTKKWDFFKHSTHKTNSNVI